MRDSGSCDLGLVLRIRFRNVEDLLHSIKVRIPQSGLVTFLEDAGPIRPQATGRIEVLADDDQAELVRIQFHALIPCVSFSTDAQRVPALSNSERNAVFPEVGGTRYQAVQT